MMKVTDMYSGDAGKLTNTALEEPNTSKGRVGAEDTVNNLKFNYFSTWENFLKHINL